MLNKLTFLLCLSLRGIGDLCVVEYVCSSLEFIDFCGVFFL